MMFAGSYFLIIYYLPIYFQTIDGVDPAQSGVRNLPLILGVTFATIFSGASISSNGHAFPVLVVGATLATIAAGLIYTIDIGTSSGKWIGYQLLGGVGYGLAFQVPIIMVQASAPPEDLAAATSILTCKRPSTSCVRLRVLCRLTPPKSSRPSVAPSSSPQPSRPSSTRSSGRLHELAPDINPGLIISTARHPGAPGLLRCRAACGSGFVHGGAQGRLRHCRGWHGTRFHRWPCRPLEETRHGSRQDCCCPPPFKSYRSAFHFGVLRRYVYVVLLQ